MNSTFFSVARKGVSACSGPSWTSDVLLVDASMAVSRPRSDTPMAVGLGSPRSDVPMAVGSPRSDVAAAVSLLCAAVAPVAPTAEVQSLPPASKNPSGHELR